MRKSYSFADISITILLTAMRNASFITIVLTVAIFAFAACSKKENISIPELVQAEAIMYEHPDSALQILQEMQTPASSQKLEYATWALLMTHAKYKMFIRQTDSLVNIAYSYFMKREDAQRKALVLYLKGGICQDNKDIEEAQRLFLEASGYAEKNDDYQLCYLINAQLGNIYVLRSYKEYALDAFSKAYQYALKSNNSEYIASSQMYLGRVYSIQLKFDLAIECYKNAIEVAKQNHSLRKIIASCNELAGVYTETKDYEQAMYYVKQAIKNNSIGAIKGQINLVIGDIYNRTGLIDSAYYYLDRVIAFEKNPRTVNSACRILYDLSKKERKFKEAMFYSDKLLSGLDSLYSSHRDQELAKMQEKYNQQKVINEKNQLKIEKDKNTRTALMALVLLICVIATLIYIYQRKLMKKERTIQKKEEEIRRSMMQISENRRLIKHNQSKMEELMAQIKANKGMQEQLKELSKTYSEMQQQNGALSNENQVLQENIEQYSSSLDAQSEELRKLNELTEEIQRLHDREKALSTQLVKNTKVLNNLITDPQYIDTIQWKDIEEAVNTIFDNFTERLSQKISTLTEYDLHLCCLIKLRMNNASIATALGISSASVSKQKFRLKERITQQVVEFRENFALDLWLWDFYRIGCPYFLFTI